MISERDRSEIGNPKWAVILFVGAVVLYLITYGCSRSSKKAPNPGENETLLFQASSNGNLDEMRRLLDEGTNVNARQQDGGTPLMFAAVEGKTDAVALLLDRGASIDAVSTEGETALSRAIVRKQYEAATRLLDRGANVNLGVNGTALMYAAGEDDLKGIKLLLERGADINVADSDGDTALTAAIYRGASPEVVRFLLTSGVNASVKNRRGDTPLIVAERNKNDALIDVLKKSH